jgi:hypothetical protein
LQHEHEPPGLVRSGREEESNRKNRKRSRKGSASASFTESGASNAATQSIHAHSLTGRRKPRCIAVSMLRALVGVWWVSASCSEPSFVASPRPSGSPRQLRSAEGRIGLHPTEQWPAMKKSEANGRRGLPANQRVGWHRQPRVIGRITSGLPCMPHYCTTLVPPPCRHCQQRAAGRGPGGRGGGRVLPRRKASPLTAHCTVQSVVQGDAW